MYKEKGVNTRELGITMLFSQMKNLFKKINEWFLLQKLKSDSRYKVLGEKEEDEIYNLGFLAGFDTAWEKMTQLKIFKRRIENGNFQ